ncbi:MAG: hypothetical protein DRN12_00090 [Thermoplasmata archaeon]|nr:MAG: hypothetical protein DRN12_00090 [Thermoplasmata archaeon]
MVLVNIASKKKKEEGTSKEEDLICRFVVDGAGREIGESITLKEDILIVKKGKKFLGIPVKHIEDKGSTLLVKGLIDLEKAEELGERWLKKEGFDGF